MNLSENAKFILKGRYLRNGESPEERFGAVAWAVAHAEHPFKQAGYAQKFYDMMTSLDFLPNTPCLANGGRENGQLNACFVLPVEDTLTNAEQTGIMDTARATALIHQTGGGTGFDFSRLRAAGSPVRSSNGVASGPVSFMRMYDAITDTIKQGGIRRGANMGILRVDHPDIREFINAKLEQKGLNNFNISVAVTDEFMRKVQDGDTESRLLWNDIANAAWKYGDPGLFFIDQANRYNPIPEYPIRATNPCGEIPMPDNDACNLGSINLGHFYSDGGFQWERFMETVHLAIRFLDDVVTVNRVPVPAIQEFTKQTRRLGLGVMGWADLLNQMGVRYDSEKALYWAEAIGKVLQEEAMDESAKLAKEKGPYPLSPDGRYRNVAILSVAPTGSISLIASCSPSIEPDYSEEYTHTGALGTITIRSPHAGREYFRTAHQIDPVWHVRHQAAWQHHIDNGVSKTVNMNNTATPDDVRAVYQLAWSQRCKGITVFRDGSRDLQVYKASKCIDGACEIDEHGHE